MGDPMLDQALDYFKLGLSVIPCRKDKTPLVPWTDCQHERPGTEQLTKWWNKYRKANCGIVTGAISGIDVLDIDSKEAYEKINEEYISESVETPVLKTPSGGYQMWFKYRKGLPTRANYMPDVDVRSDGGFAVAPVSFCEYTKRGKDVRGSHEWLNGLNPFKLQAAPWPDFLYNTLLQCSYSSSFTTTSSSTNDAKELLRVTNQVIKFDEGGRDDSIFHLIWHLRKSGMPRQEIEIYANFIAQNCNPPYPPEDVEQKIKSAFDRKKRAENGLTADIREFLSVTKGNFDVTSICRSVASVTTSGDRASVRSILHRMVKDGTIKRDPSRDGVFRKVEVECETIDFKNCNYKPAPMKLPLGMSEIVQIMPGNIIIVAGVSNMGKTAFMIDMIYRNMNKFDVTYFNSEMDGKELNKRLVAFQAVRSINDWKFKSREVIDHMEDVIESGEGKINIIDYLEVDKDFFLIPGMIRAIHAKLNGAIAVIALQKKPGAVVGVGGYGTINKARLAINIEKGICEIMKAKNWASMKNPNGLKLKFEIEDGWNLSPVGTWYRDQE